MRCSRVSHTVCRDADHSNVPRFMSFVSLGTIDSRFWDRLTYDFSSLV
jgi:hypothetical protein